jgi:multidrug efflux pump subunit AcrA (membrane-fusion protein)
MRRPLHPRRRRLALVAAAALLPAGFLGWSAGREGDGEWVEVRRGDLVVGVEVTGTLAAVDAVRLGPPPIANLWDFKLAFQAPEGTEVQAGTPVLGFDASELERDLLEKQAERDTADKELEKRATRLGMDREKDALRLAEASARRRRAALKVDVPAELLSAHELADARRDLALAEGEIAYLTRRLELLRRQARAELDSLAGRRDRAALRVREIEQQIAQMTVRAPRPGTVIYLADWQGTKKKVGDSVWKGQTVVEIPDLARMRADGQVAEAEAGRVRPGQRVTLRLDAHPDLRFAGRVRSLRGTVETRSPADPQKVVALEIALDATDRLRMRPGMRFQGEVEVERVRGALLAPSEAVFATAAGPRVWRRQLLGAEEVRPHLGRRDARAVEVLAGLVPGDLLARRDLALDEEAP